MGLVYVGVVTETQISNTKPGSEYGMPCGYVLPTKHYIKISMLQKVEVPPGTPSDSDYWHMGVGFKMNYKFQEKLLGDLK
jgi:hypothetical protein